jgi:ribosomal protein S18 acetylase RimI-like enzyme/predicted nucleic acid-binding protein/predicted transcriptional regulator
VLSEQSELLDPEDVRVAEVDVGTARYRDVLALANGPAKRWLGPMPDSGFADRARKGTLLAAVCGESTAGYVLYDLPADRVKIVHLCVDESVRRRGVARRLVEEVSARHADRRGIELSCRRDYEANALWSRLGFRPANTRIGRSKAQAPLTVWLLDHGHDDLLSSLVTAQECAALDHMVFLDLVEPLEKRPQGAESRELAAAWLGEYVDLCVTDEVFHEIENVEETPHRASLQSKAPGFPKLARGQRLGNDLVASIASMAPAADPPDHRHVARALVGGADYLVTRDDGLLRAAKAIERTYGLLVLRPAALIARLDSMRSEGRYMPTALHETDLSEQRVGEADLVDFTGRLLTFGAGERRHQLAGLVQSAVAAPDSHEARLVRDAAGEVLGGYIRREDAGEIEVLAIRVVGRDAQASALARSLAFEQRRAAAEIGGGGVTIADSHPSPPLIDAFEREGYERRADGTWRQEVRVGLIDVLELGASIPANRRLSVVHEAQRWPQKVVGADINTYIVSIGVAYAEQLLDPRLAAQTLLPRQTLLGIGREHVYYRKPRNHGGIRAGDRILWYVTGTAPSHPQGSVRALSVVEEVVIGPPRRLYHRFSRLGVYSKEEVLATANGTDEVMAIRFGDTELLQRPLTRPELDDLFVTTAGRRFHAPRSPRRLDEHMFCRVYERACGYGFR